MFETVFWNNSSKTLFIGEQSDLKHLNSSSIEHKTVLEDEKPKLLDSLDGYSIVDKDEFERVTSSE